MPPLLAPLRPHWQRLAPRERQLVALATALVGAALLWWLALAPALHTWRQSGARQQALDAEWQQMITLQAQARQLQALPRLSRAEALQALETSVRQRLGSTAQLAVQGERATLTLKAASGEALSQWLALARANARTQPHEARLTRSPGTAPTAAVAWDGTLVLALPPQ